MRLPELMRDLRSRPVVSAALGLFGVAVIDGILIAVDPDITRAVPLLLLLIPVTATSVLGGWRASVPVALVTGSVYSLAFLAPGGVIRIGLTEDTVTLVTFVSVAVLVSLLGGLAGRRDRQRDRHRAVLLRGVSHDLRNPLGTIRAASAELRDGVVTDPILRNELLDLVVDESERLDRIVANLLSVSRIEGGALAPTCAPESLAQIVGSSVGRLARRDGHRIVIEVSDDLPDVAVDRTQLDQVITNVVENGLRHGGRGGEVRISAMEVGELIEVAVCDRGPGFSAEARAHAFDFFQSVGPTASSGIGLGVCRAIVHAHGGTIRIGDEQHGGARVSFTIPKA
ncbi:MAG: ATP-binding protein [Ilumatobacteraceae bacterium]